MTGKEMKGTRMTGICMTGKEMTGTRMSGDCLLGTKMMYANWKHCMAATGISKTGTKMT